MATTLFSPNAETSLPSLSFPKPNLTQKSIFTFKKTHLPCLSLKASTGNGAGITSSAAIVDDEKIDSLKIEGNGAAVAVTEEVEVFSGFVNPKWVNGTWDLNQFQNDGFTDWDAVIDAEVRRRKWCEENPPSSSNDDPIIFNMSVIPWWAWMKRFHLPEAELLNGRAAMIGFFMAYLVDSLTGVSLVDQMGNFFCKSLLFVVVSGVLIIRKNEDLDNLKNFFEETTFYDKQWQATWKDEPPLPK